MDNGLLIFVGPNSSRDVMELVNQHSRSILIEPLPFVCDQLYDQISGRSDVEIVEAACANECGLATMNVYNDNGMSSSFGTVSAESAEVFPGADLSLRDVIDVETIHLGRFLRERLIDRIAMLKIDAQGMDLEILKTVEPWISAGKISYIQTEADELGFHHYDGIPENSGNSHRCFMSTMPYESMALPGFNPKHPDLLWRYKKKC